MPGTSAAQAFSHQEADQAQHIQRQAVAAQAAHTSQAQLSASGNAPPSRRSHRSVTMHSLPLQPWPSVQMSPSFQVSIQEVYVSCWLFSRPASVQCQRLPAVLPRQPPK